MRYSTEPSDPGYTNWLKARHAGTTLRYYLNGKERKEVVMADEDAGIIIELAQPLKLGPGYAWRRVEHRGTVKVEA